MLRSKETLMEICEHSTKKEKIYWKFYKNYD